MTFCGPIGGDWSRKKSLSRFPHAYELLRGTSQRPLFVTAIGIDYGQAARWIGRMHGDNRLPTILKQVDRLARNVGSDQK